MQHQTSANPADTPLSHLSHSLLHLLLLIQLSLFVFYVLSVILFFFFTLSTYSLTDGHVSFSFFESLLAKKLSCIFHPLSALLEAVFCDI
jgi:hypothetical protein